LSRKIILTVENLWDVIERLQSRCIQQEMSIRKRLQLSPAEYLALRRLRVGEKITCRELARRMELSLSRTSRVIDRLYTRGYLERGGCAADRRCKSIGLTERGIGACRRIQHLRRECATRLLDGYSEAERTALMQDLDGLACRMSED
jgi:DNA-binding MarR family transcriptional regulator